MNLFERPLGGLALHFDGFIEGVHSYCWDGWSDEALSARICECRQGNENTTEACSILKEIIRRKTGLILFDAQLMAAYSMLQGHIAELPTGEGKTLAAVVTATIFALQKKPVHILVFNDYLACRDYYANHPIYEACGLTCGYIVEASDFAHRKSAYVCDVVYISAKEAGFDCLRDFLCTEKDRLLFPSFSVALIDEADSILIDEARIPLVLAGNADVQPSITAHISKAVSELSEDDVGIHLEENQVWLTENGVRTMEARMRIENLCAPENANALALINAALDARYLLRKDKDYIVKDGAVLVIDESTGRIAENRRFPDLLHQAVEMQELGVHGNSSVIYNSITMQAFLRQYAVLCGMTGTAASSAYEFRQNYGLEIDVIPPHTPCVRIDHPDALFLKKNEQESEILSCILSSHAKGQPVLIGTQSVEESERFSCLLATHSVPHSVLNAKNDTDEAAIIAEAGSPYQVTISTNMAGRGVDIRLGGCDEKDADFVRSAGGLLVISTGINRSLRIDNQLRGRAGRQGDPGESRFFVCLEDLTLETYMGIEYEHYTRYPKLLRRAQRTQERKDVEARYMLERYSSILEGQRKWVTEYRMQVLRDEHISEVMRTAEPEFYQSLVERVGKRGVATAEKQLLLYFINQNWASYLESMEHMRSGVHLMVIGKKNPLDEYAHFSISAFDEMLDDTRRDVVEHMKKCNITENGIDMEGAGLLGATSSWTYMIDDSASQFSRIPQIVQAVTHSVKGTLFSLRGIFAKLRERYTKLRSRRE